MDLNDLTPVVPINGIFYKRDDLYAPYGDNFVSGGKVRQCRDLIMSNMKHIQENCDNTIATAASIASPQSVIVSRVAQEFGMKSIIGFGNTTIEKAKFRNPVIPDCKLELNIEAIRSHGRVWKYKGEAFVGTKKMADAHWTATIVDRK